MLPLDHRGSPFVGAADGRSKLKGGRIQDTTMCRGNELYFAKTLMEYWGRLPTSEDCTAQVVPSSPLGTSTFRRSPATRRRSLLWRGTPREPSTSSIDALAACDGHQSVFSATRGENILDLTIASGGAAVSEVPDKLFDSDHHVVETFFAVNTGAAPCVTRSNVYNYKYKRADFAGLKQALRLIPWDLMRVLDVDAAVTFFTILLSLPSTTMYPW